MVAVNYYQRHLGDYAKDTGWLSTYQHGVYALLLDWYYSNEKPIPVDLAYRIVKARSGPERAATQEVLLAFFDLNKCAGFAHHKRADIDLAKYQTKSAANSLIAQKAWDAKRMPNASQSHSEIDASHKPVTNSHKEAKEDAPAGALFDGVSPQVVADFKALRRTKKAAITATAVAGIRREASKAGLSFESALAMCCERGWTGFKAEWVTGAPTPTHSAPGGGRREL